MRIATILAEVLAGAGFSALVIWLKIDQFRRAEDEKTHTADIQTLFSGRK